MLANSAAAVSDIGKVIKEIVDDEAYPDIKFQKAYPAKKGKAVNHGVMPSRHADAAAKSFGIASKIRIKRYERWFNSSTFFASSGTTALDYPNRGVERH